MLKPRLQPHQLKPRHIYKIFLPNESIGLTKEKRYEIPYNDRIETNDLFMFLESGHRSDEGEYDDCDGQWSVIKVLGVNREFLGWGNSLQNRHI